jgi:two-component sensor histidine kinase
MKASLHPRQEARLAALRGYNILDTPREADFDEIVALASQICEAPISVVNLVDAERQWFKAEVGLGVRETPIETSICAHAILEEAFVEIPDTLQDQRMRGNALCDGEPGLRFYAGAQLQTPDGLPLGTLCVLDYKPRTLTPLQRNAIIVLGRQVMAQLDLRLALRRQKLLLKEIDHRVKNSLASISALIKLQARAAKDDDSLHFLEAVDSRISRIGALHEQLYKAGDGGEVNLGDYIDQVVTTLRATGAANVRIELSADMIVANPPLAAAFGVIVSEFVMNSLKHAFPDGRHGQVSIALKADGPGIKLTCRDNGVGFFDASAKRGIGLRLIEASAAQCGARVETLEATPGFGIAVCVPA